MYLDFIQALTTLDNKIKLLDDRQIQHEFELIPLETFGEIQVDRPDQFPNLMKWLPVMPSAAVQQSWTGNCDHELMRQSVSFIRTTVSKYHEIACKPLTQGRVLDFGCGWGRLIRLLYKYVPTDHIYGVDPKEESINLCRQTQLYGNFSLSEYLPTTLPIDSSIKFDLIIAFSVFTHLSEKSFSVCASVIQDYLSENGVVALTIRPREYWTYIHDTSPFYAQISLSQMLEDHDHKGFAFYPHQKKMIMGEVTYGETTASVNFLKNTFPGLEFAGIEWSEADPFQVMVFLKKRKEVSHRDGIINYFLRNILKSNQ
jgi:SAM-dependent methyltransferase